MRSWFNLGVVLVVAACSEATPPSAPKKDYVGVSIRDNAFEPAEVTIKVGQHVTWYWEGQNQHGIRFFGSPTVAAAPQGNGNLYDRAFDKPGLYIYYCPVHGGSSTLGATGMSGKIFVE
jgi:plastocyanin